MIEKTTFDFLKNLNKNNNKIWFETNRKKYALAKENVLQLVSNVLSNVVKFDTSLLDIESKKCLFRINRDVRFSNNKDPYKNNMGAWFNEGGKKIWNAGYYIHIEPGNCFLAAGMYQPDATMLAKIRQEIDYNFSDFKKVVENKKFVTTFGGLSKEDGMVQSRPPKGYDIENPAIEYLKHKSFVVRYKLTDAEVLDVQFVKKATELFKLMYPMVYFFNAAIV